MVGIGGVPLDFHFTGFAGIRALCNQYNILMICDEALALLFKLAMKTVEFVVVLFSKYLEVSLYWWMFKRSS